MQTFTIDQENNICVLAPEEDATGEPQEGVVRFHSEQQLGALTTEWPGRRLVELWNRFPALSR